MSETNDAPASEPEVPAAVEAAPETVAEPEAAPEPTFSETADARRAALVTRLEGIRAVALQAKRQNMLDALAEAVADLVGIMLGEMG